MYRKPLRAKTTTQSQIDNLTTVPAPVMGLNRRDNFASMKSTYAITLDNWFPNPSDLMPRLGYVPLTTSAAPADLIQLIQYTANGTNDQMFALADNGNLYRCDTGTFTTTLTGLSNSRMDYINFTTSGGSFMIWVNGTDAPQFFDGTSWTVASITGVDGGANTLNNLAAYSKRIFFLQKNSMSVWYLDVDSIQGAATELPLGQLFEKGGRLVGITTWSKDAGILGSSGMNDVICFVTSEGEVAMFQGTDPNYTPQWSLVGIYQMGTPLGRSHIPFLSYQGEVYGLTSTGLMPFSVIADKGANPTKAATDLIRDLINEDISAYGEGNDWELLLYPKGQWMMIHVPSIYTSQIHQYVMNIITGAWCRFTGIPAVSWTNFNNAPYFAGKDRKVYKFWSGLSDNGADIECKAKTAWNDFGFAGEKDFKMLRPNLTADSSFTYSICVNTDFNEFECDYTIDAIALGAAWDSAVWDVDTWVGVSTAQREWSSSNGIGVYAALKLSIMANGINLRWNAIDYAYEKGGPL